VAANGATSGDTFSALVAERLWQAGIVLIDNEPFTLSLHERGAGPDRRRTHFPILSDEDLTAAMPGPCHRP